MTLWNGPYFYEKSASPKVSVTILCSGGFTPVSDQKLTHIIITHAEVPFKEQELATLHFIMVTTRSTVSNNTQYINLKAYWVCTKPES